MARRFYHRFQSWPRSGLGVYAF